MSSSTLSIPTARVFQPLLRAARYKGAHGGRGSGKSHFFAEATVERCVEYPGTRIVCVREVQRSLKESVKRLVEDKIDHLTDSIVAPGGGVILFQGMQDHTAESIKSLEGFDVAYVEEAQTMTSRSLEFLRPTIRKDATAERPGSELWFSWNPRHSTDPVDELLRSENPPANSGVVQSLWRDNPFFPDVLEEERLYDLRNKPDRYAHIWEGEYEPAALGALWNREIFHRNRRSEPPDMGRIVIGIDPPKKDDEGSDEAGIVACGIGQDGRGYVLDDASRNASPEEWAKAAIALYDLHDADAIVVEINNGGQMVKSTLHSVRSDVKVIEVTATRGKHIRAEPIAALYSLNRISHVGAFPELEMQMCMMTPQGYEGSDSPDRLDAVIWCFTELFPRMTRKVASREHAPKQQNHRYDVHRRERKIA